MYHKEESIDFQSHNIFHTAQNNIKRGRDTERCGASGWAFQKGSASTAKGKEASYRRW